jgi:hypothetical protein
MTPDAEDDDNLRNAQSRRAPQVRHTVHPSVTQEGPIGDPMANADTLSCPRAHPNAAESKNVLEVVSSAERMETQNAIPHPR